MKTGFLLTAFLLLLLSVSCQALVVESPSTIIVQQEQKDVLITVYNDTSTEQNYIIAFTAPIDAVISPSAGRLGAGKKIIVTFSVSPAEELAGSTYNGALQVELGNEKASKNISVIFKEEGEQGNSGEEGNNFSFAGFASFFGGIFSLENALNLVLVAIAAVLLIAFIARFVRRVNQ